MPVKMKNSDEMNVNDSFFRLLKFRFSLQFHSVFVARPKTFGIFLLVESSSSLGL